MRFVLATVMLAMIGATPSAASSFVMLKRSETQPSPSIIMFVEPEQAAAADAPDAHDAAEPARFTRISGSIVAMGEPAADATIVAEPKPMRNPHLPPMVIRGGLTGEALPRGTGLSQAPAAAPLREAAQAPQNAPAPDQQRPPEAPRAPPPPQPQAPAAPTRAQR